MNASHLKLRTNIVIIYCKVVLVCWHYGAFSGWELQRITHQILYFNHFKILKIGLVPPWYVIPSWSLLFFESFKYFHCSKKLFRFTDSWSSINQSLAQPLWWTFCQTGSYGDSAWRESTAALRLNSALLVKYIIIIVDFLGHIGIFVIILLSCRNISHNICWSNIILRWPEIIQRHMVNYFSNWGC